MVDVGAGEALPGPGLCELVDEGAREGQQPCEEHGAGSVAREQAVPAAQRRACDGHALDELARTEAIGDERPDQLPAVAARTASGRLIQP